MKYNFIDRVQLMCVLTVILSSMSLYAQEPIWARSHMIISSMDNARHSYEGFNINYVRMYYESQVVVRDSVLMDRFFEEVEQMKEKWAESSEHLVKEQGEWEYASYGNQIRRVETVIDVFKYGGLFEVIVIMDNKDIIHLNISKLDSGKLLFYKGNNAFKCFMYGMIPLPYHSDYCN